MGSDEGMSRWAVLNGAVLLHIVLSTKNMSSIVMWSEQAWARKYHVTLELILYVFNTRCTRLSRLVGDCIFKPKDQNKSRWEITYAVLQCHNHLVLVISSLCKKNEELQTEEQSQLN